jgi:polar amino acid transport system substrate-binding protein
MNKLVLAIATLVVGTGLASAQETVRIGTEGAFPPYNFINDDNELDGFERDLGDEACARANLTCEWVINDWDTIIPNLVAGNFDVIMAGMAETEARSEVIAFSQPYLPLEPSIYMTRAGNDESVIDGVVAAQSSTMQADYVAETGASLLEFATPDETVAAVRAGEADAVLANRSYLEPIVEESGGELIIVGEELDIGGGVGMGLRKSDEELLATFDGVIAEMKQDGSLNKLLVKWFGEDTDLF